LRAGHFKSHVNSLAGTILENGYKKDYKDLRACVFAYVLAIYSMNRIFFGGLTHAPITLTRLWTINIMLVSRLICWWPYGPLQYLAIYEYQIKKRQ